MVDRRWLDCRPGWHGLRHVVVALALGTGFCWQEAYAQAACGSKLCPQMTTCAEAYHQFHFCRDTARDRDSDGIPCENVCGKTGPEMIARLRAQPMAGVDLAAIALQSLAAIGAEKERRRASPEGGSAPVPEGRQSTARYEAAARYRCGEKRTCREMTSCEEARYHLDTCGLGSLDGDRDGVPCNRLCRTRRRR